MGALHIRKSVRHGHYLVYLAFTLVMGCQATEGSLVTPKESNQHAAMLEPRQDMTGVPTLDIPLVELPSAKETPVENSMALPLPTPVKKILPPAADGFKAETSDLINKQVCRDNVEVSYSVMDQNGYRSTFRAKVQAQAIVKGQTSDQQQYQLQITGWFTNNKNLRQWQPYLKKPPLTKDISLKIGAMVWDLAERWYSCERQVI